MHEVDGRKIPLATRTTAVDWELQIIVSYRGLTVISAERFEEVFAEAVVKGDAAIFAGAGVSRPAGFVNWKELVEPFARRVNLDVNRETDLIAVTQYYRNEMGTRSEINDRIIQAFLGGSGSNSSIDILASLPINTYWTTNYDHLIEDALKACGKRVEVKESQDDLSVTMPDRDAVVYKMHGDASHPAKCVITKDDYESYMVDRRLFVTSLQGDLITKTFLFIGFSFSDPNFSAILSRLRILLDENVRTHYCLLKRACRGDYESDADYHYAQTKQDLMNRDLARYGIRPVLLESYGEVPQVLNRVRTMVRCRTVFISGSAAQYGPAWERDAVSLVYKLTRALLRGGYRVVTGHGRGIGSYVISAAIDELGVSGLDGRLIIQAFPYEETRRGDYRALCRSYREGIAKRAGVGLYLFGNKLQGSDIVSADGMLEEYELLRSEGSLAIPVASTGFAAEKIFALEKKRGTLLAGIEELDDEMNVSRIIEIILSVLEHIQRGEIPRR